MDPNTLIRISTFIPGICETLSRRAQRLDHEDTMKRAAEAGYDDVNKYIYDRFKKNPIYPARQYLECVNEYGVGSTVCNSRKERWLELKAAENGNKVAWNEEEVHKMLKKDAIKAGYKEGYFFKKDPRYLKSAARNYEECIARHGVGAEDTLCKFKKQVWLEAKSFQNA